MGRLASLLVALAAAACTAAPDVSPPPPPLVRAHRVTSASGREIELRGQLAPRSRVRLSFKQGGVVESVLVREGDRIAPGQLVARLDGVDARAAVRMARAAIDKARRDAERSTRLAGEGALATSVSDDARSALEAAEAQLLQAEDALARTRLTAPLAGTIFKRVAEPGETLGAGDPVAFLDSTAALEVEAGATLRESQALRAGLAAQLVPDEGDPVPGRIASVATTPNPGDGLYAVTVAAERTPTTWRAGALLRVRVGVDAASAVLRIPLEALVHRQNKDHVFVLADVSAGGGALSGTVRMRPIVAGAAEAREVLVVSGLEPGEEIVAEGAYFLQDGQAVRVLR
jgi:RND family efflux transporter MFP subunit